jgi:hypothetical protein
MRMMSKKLSLTLLLAVASAHSVACNLQIEQILEVQDGSEFTIQILTLPPSTLVLEGGTVMNIDIQIGILDLIFGNIDGDITTDELLIASPSFLILGTPTGIVCIVPDPVDPGSGTFDANIYAGTADFDVQLNTVAILGNPVLMALLGGGLPFPFALQSQVPFGIVEILGLLTGAGGFDISQPIDEVIGIDLDGPGPQPPIPGTLTGQINMGSADAFPTSPLLDDCITLLATP